jgi:hypothetical protein
MGFDPLMGGMMGLGLAKDVFGGLSAYNQAQRQKQQYDYAKQFQNPQWVLGQSQPYTDRLMAAMRQQLPATMRQTINPFLGTHGIDPASGAGQSIYANAIAPQILQAQEQGVQQFLNASGQGQQYGTQNIGPTYGGNNGLQDALKMYYMSRAGQPRAQEADSVNAMAPYSGASGLEGLNRFTVPNSTGASYDPFDSMYNSNAGGGMG